MTQEAHGTHWSNVWRQRERLPRSDLVFLAHLQPEATRDLWEKS
jgi:hypothetical protein